VTALEDQNHQGELPPPFQAKLYIIRDWITLFNAID